MTLEERARKIKLILMDVDGTLTNGTIFILPNGEETKAFNVRDGMGILMAKQAGLITGVISGKTSRTLLHRARRLRMDEVHEGIQDKKAVLEEILRRHQLKPHEVAYIGDDLGDLEVMRMVGLAAAVADAHPLVKQNCHYLCKSEGGRGAVREFIEFILTSQGKMEDIEAKVKHLLDPPGENINQ
ncbi:MAG: HAD hydrolase family protein [Candidatus Aminicenantes bacterium]|nr:HAD hydrolase family protein [Candidatus Aminicenantes bacterium]